MSKLKNCTKGFTLLELLVVVLIIGILAAIALPQYQMAVTKAKVASILPLMRRWKDALQEYKLQHGDYCIYENGECNVYLDGSDLGVNWPSDWNNGNCGDGYDCSNDYWRCVANEELTGYVYCHHSENKGKFDIWMLQPDEPDWDFARDKILCTAQDEKGNKVCKALGGKPVEDMDNFYILH